MELDDFKSLLKSKEEEPLSVRSAAEIEQYTHRSAVSVIAKIKKNIRFELRLCILIVLPFAVLCFVFPSFYMRSLVALAVFVCIFFVIYLLRLNKRIHFYETASFSIKDSLQQVIYILGKFTRHYLQITMIMLPVAFVFGLVTGYMDITGDLTIKKFNWTRSLVFYSSFFIVWSVFTYFFTKWYIKKLYGNYLQQLKEQLKELENG
jgi:hypothetical protein